MIDTKLEAQTSEEIDSKPEAAGWIILTKKCTDLEEVLSIFDRKSSRD